MPYVEPEALRSLQHVAVDPVDQSAVAPAADKVVRAGRIDPAAAADVEVVAAGDGVERVVGGHGGVVQRHISARAVYEHTAARCEGAEPLAGGGVGVRVVIGDEGIGHRQPAAVVNAAPGQVHEGDPGPGVNDVEAHVAAGDRAPGDPEAAAAGAQDGGGAGVHGVVGDVGAGQHQPGLVVDAAALRVDREGVPGIGRVPDHLAAIDRDPTAAVDAAPQAAGRGPGRAGVGDVVDHAQTRGRQLATVVVDGAAVTGDRGDKAPARRAGIGDVAGEGGGGHGQRALAEDAAPLPPDSTQDRLKVGDRCGPP